MYDEDGSLENRKKCFPQRKGVFTLIELLVVIAIIAILVISIVTVVFRQLFGHSVFFC